MTNLEPGQSFGHFTIVSQSVCDEAGTIYRAYDSAAASDVLLRVLPAALAQAAGFEARFQVLGASLRKLSHPNILRVLETGIENGTPYWTMPIVDVAPLSERIAAGQVAPAQADKLMGQIVGALQYAHDNGMAHGALNPAHVLVDGSGNALLTDFGLASLQPGASAPDPRADVAALGGVLLSLLTGTSATPDDSALSDALGRLTTALPADRREAIGAAYARVVQKLTAANLADRYESARAFLSAWQDAGKTAAAAVTSPGTPAMGVPPSGQPVTGDVPPSTRTPVPPPVMPPLPVMPPAVPGISTPRPHTGTAVSTSAQDVAQARARAQQIMDEAQAKNKAAVDAARTQTNAAVHKAQGDLEFAQAQARDAAARAPGASPSARDTMRSALEISQRIARGTTDPVRRAALEQIIADIRKIGEQRTAGTLTDDAAHAAISDLVRQVRTLETQAAPAARDAVKGATAAALSQVKSAAQVSAPAVAKTVQRQAAAAARPAVSQARPIVAGGVVIIMVLCVGLMILCGVFGSLLPNATPTPRAVATERLTRSAPTATARPSVVLSTPRAGASPTATGPTATPAPLRTSVVYTDSFASGSCSLVEGDDPRRTLKCDRNQYVMLVKSSTTRWVYYDAPPEYQNTVIDFDARAISSSSSMQYGVIWRVSSDGESFYGFTLKPNGQVAVFLYQNSEFSYFVQGLTVPNFRTGGNLNHVTITANGPDIAFAVNDQPLSITLSDDTLTSGTIGFIVDTSAPNAQAAFSNLVVAEIK